MEDHGVQGFGFALVMGDQDHGAPFPVGTHRFDSKMLGVSVQPLEGLVEKEHVPFAEQRAHQRDAPGHAAGQFRGQHPAGSAEADLLQTGFDLFRGQLGVDEADVSCGAAPGEEAPVSRPGCGSESGDSGSAEENPYLREGGDWRDDDGGADAYSTGSASPAGTCGSASRLRFGKEARA